MCPANGHNLGIRQDPEKLQRLVDLFNRGYTYEHIASELSVTSSRIQQIVKRLEREGLLTGNPRR